MSREERIKEDDNSMRVITAGVRKAKNTQNCTYNKEKGTVIYMETYKEYTIFEKQGKFTVGGRNNAEFEDCSLENLAPKIAETEMVEWCRDNEAEISFIDFRTDKAATYEQYMEHLSCYKTSPDGAFLDKCFIVPTVCFDNESKAKQFIDWLDGELKKSRTNAETALNSGVKRRGR